MYAKALTKGYPQRGLDNLAVNQCLMPADPLAESTALLKNRNY